MESRFATFILIQHHIYLVSHFCEYLTEFADFLFNIILIPTMNIYIISIDIHLINSLASEGKTGSLSHIILLQYRSPLIRKHAAFIDRANVLFSFEVYIKCLLK